MTIKISESEFNTLKIYFQKAEELSNSRILQNGTPNISLTFRADVDKGFKESGKFPDEEDFRSMLMSLRVFYMNKEKISFFKVVNIIYKRLDDEEKKTILKSIRKIFSNALKGTARPGAFKIIYNKHQYTPQEIFDLFLNSVYFHTSEDKITEFNNLKISMGVNPIRFVMQDTVYILAECILHLKEFIENNIFTNCTIVHEK